MINFVAKNEWFINKRFIVFTVRGRIYRKMATVPAEHNAGTVKSVKNTFGCTIGTMRASKA